MLFDLCVGTMKAVVVCVVLFSVMCSRGCNSFNLDTRYPTVYSVNDDQAEFGFNVALHKNEGRSSVLISAIKAMSNDAYRPGAIFRCETDSSFCNTLHIRDEKPLASGVQYRPVKDNMTLGMSLAVKNMGLNSIVVVCAPLWKVLSPKRGNLYTPNGLCYFLNKDLSLNRVVSPFISEIQQTVSFPGRNVYYYGMAEFGMSASFTQEHETSGNSQIVVGAPGYYDWTGNIAEFEVINDQIDRSAKLGRHTENSSKNLKFDTEYIGYSVASGRFFDKDTVYIAAGAPRDNDLKGSVLIIDRKPLSDSSSLVIRIRKNGLQIGEYFGASILAVDLNNDFLTDLLVGAPQYSLPSGSDEGRVFVYVSSGGGLLDKGFIMGEPSVGARFGTAIANIGDINLDGFTDVAIGAPYENRNGAVYIFNGNSQGLNTKYSQRIEGRSIRSIPGKIPEGFGISISQGLDVDNNGYPDIAIGSFISNQALLFKSSPIITVKGSITFNKDQIIPDDQTCSFEGKSFFCFDVKACLQYNGVKVSDRLEFDIKLEMDPQKTEFSRGFLAGPTNTKEVFLTDSLSVQKERESCKTYKAYIQETIKDIVTPMQFRLTFNVSNPSQSEFCNICPVLDQKSANSVINKIRFRNLCGDDNICKSDLRLSAFIVGHNKDEPLYARKGEPFTLRIILKNVGRDPAYLTEVDVTLSEELRVINQGSCSDKKTGLNKTFQCDVGNPLPAGQGTTTDLKIELEKETTKVKMEIVARTGSEDNNPDKKRVVIDLEYVNRADINIYGSSSLNKLIFHENSTVFPLTHTFIISKLYESPIDRVEATILVPASFSKTRHTITTLDTIQADDGSSVPGSCNSTAAILLSEYKGARSIRLDFWNRGDESLQVIRHLEVKCGEGTFKCRRITCEFGPFYDTTKVAKVRISFKVNITSIIQEVGIPEMLDIISTGQVRIIDNKERVKPPKPGNKITEVVTTFYKEGPPAPEEVPIWIYIVSVLAGLLIITALILLLFKLGFFRRLKKEKMMQSGALLEKNEREEREIAEEVVEREKDYAMNHRSEDA